MITNRQTLSSKTDLRLGEIRRPPDRLLPSRGFRRASIALVALVLSVGGQIAHAGEAAAPAAPTLSRAAAQNVSAKSLVAQAEADLAAGHPGLAILQYDRAQLLAPRAPAVVAGLTRAQSAAGLPMAEASPVVRVARRLNANEWGWIGMAGLILGAAGLVALSWGLIRRSGFLALVLAGVGIASAGFVSAVEVTPPPNRAIVVAPDTVARIAPFAKADQAFAVPEGTPVTIERTYGKYALIASSEGYGWVPEGGVEIILPATRKGS
jgi:hypothetical protein